MEVAVNQVCGLERRLVLAGLAILAIVLSGCGRGKAPTATPSLNDQYVPVVSVTGELLPASWATLANKAGGKVAEVLVEPGDAVSQGQVLVRLDTAELQVALRVAQQEVAAQQAALDGLIERASEQVIARADRENAQQVAQAELALRIQRRQLEQARAQSPADEVAAAQARVRQLELQVAQARAQDPAAEVTAAQVEMERAQIALDDTRNEYNKALDRPWEDQDIRDAWAKQLEQAQLNSRLAQARLDGALSARRAHTIGLDVLAAQLVEARAMLDQALEAQEAYTSTLGILNDEVAAAQLQLDYLRGWENPYRDPASEPEIAQAQARLRQAEEKVAQIEEQMQEAEVRAPFGGTVGTVPVRVGEIVSPGQALVTVGDLDTLRVETTDLDEIDVVRVSLDQDVAVTFDAVPDRVFKGRVVRISPMAEPGTGGVHYTVVVELTDMDPQLRWGMTAFVDIETQ
jgi:HlyD family secretion protein